MNRYLTVVVVTTFLMMMVPSISAQEAEAGELHLTADNVGGSADVLCDSDFVYAMTDHSEPPTEEKAYLARSFTAQSCAVTFSYVAGSTLRLGSDTTATAVVGCDAPSPDPGTPATSSGLMRLFIDGEQIGSDVRYSTGPGACLPTSDTPVTASFPTQGLEVAAGTAIDFVFVTFSPSPSGLDPVHNMYLLTGPDASRLTATGFPMPGAAAEVEPQVFFEDLPSGDVLIEASFGEPTNDIYIYNWTSDLEEVLADLSFEVENGTAFFAFVDEEDEPIVGGEITASIDLEEVLDGRRVAFIALGYEDFVGSVELAVTAAPESDDPDETDSPDTNGSTGAGDGDDEGDGDQPEGNGTADNSTVDQSASKDSPGVGLLAGLALLGTAAILVRRRC